MVMGIATTLIKYCEYSLCKRAGQRVLIELNSRTEMASSFHAIFLLICFCLATGKVEESHGTLQVFNVTCDSETQMDCQNEM